MTFAIKDPETGKYIPILISSKKNIEEDPSFYGCFVFELVKEGGEFHKTKFSIYGNKKKAFAEAESWIKSEKNLKGYSFELLEVKR